MHDDKDAKEVCRHCGRHVSTGLETEHGMFCNDHHARIWEIHNTGLLTRIRNAWVRSREARR